MPPSVGQQLAGIGKQLARPPHTKDAILKQLKIAAGMLSEMKQAGGLAATIEPLTRALVLPMLTRHKDKEVRLLTATCIMEIMRIVAPDAIYSDTELQEVFQLVVSAFEGLDEVSSSSYARRTTILEIMANLRICVVMLDVGCDDLILEMFQIFFSVISDRHLSSVQMAMQTIMATVLQESEDIPLPLLHIVLNNLWKRNKGVSAAAHKLAVGVVQQCAEKLEPYVQRLLTSVMLEGKAADIDLHADYHDIIHEIYQWAPQMVLAVLPNLTQELVNDQLEVRLKAVQLLGRLFALPGQHAAKEYRQLFSEFLKRFMDKAVEVRLAMIDCAKECLKANHSEREATEILAGLDDRILDSEEIVRLHAVAAICDVAKHNFRWMPVSLLMHVAERLRDKKVLVRKEAFQRLAEVYRSYCTKCYEGFSTGDKELEWIPSKLIRCCYDKDVKEFRPAAIEILLSENLFPRQLSVSERTRHWISMYIAFEEIDKKALARVLLQKQRLQEDMSAYLSLRQEGKELNTDDSHIEHLFKAMSLSFVDDYKVEENFKKLHNMKDKKIFKALSQLLDPNTSFTDSEAINEDLLKRIGKNHPQHEFMKVLALRCSFRIFGKEHSKAVLQEVTSNRDSKNMDMVAAGLALLAEFAGFFPFLIQAVKEDLLGLLFDGDDITKERVADILARAGSCICGQIDEASSSVELTLQKLCLEGTRKQAKYAVSALAALNVDGGFKALSVLYGRLMECLQEDSPRLPTVLQSLACIAQNAITVFETQEDDIVRFVVRTLRRSCVVEAGETEDVDSERQSTVCRLKIFGLKTLVKSFLPHKDHPRKRLRGLLGLLLKFLPNGDISESSGSSEIDKAHLRLASAKGILRLARRWDSQISPPIFHLCLLTAQDPCMHVRQQFLRKVHQYLKDRTLNHKYACAYALFASDSSKEILADAKHYLTDFVEVCRREARMQQNRSAAQSELSLITYNPEYVLTYLVHALAHHPSFPGSDSKTADVYEPFYRILLFYLRSLVHQDHEGLGKRDVADNLPAILSIFHTVKKAEDAVEESRTQYVHTVCDLGIVITKELGRNKLHSETYPGLIPLPVSFYKMNDDDAHSCKVDGSDLPACLIDSDALSQFWSRGSRFGQIPSLGANQHSKKVKRDVEECSFSDHGEGNDARDQVEKQNKAHDLDQDTVEIPRGSKISHGRHKSQPTKIFADSKRGRLDSGTGVRLDTSSVNGSVKGAKGKSSNATGQDLQLQHTLVLENGLKSSRTTRSQAMGARIVLGSKTAKFVESSPESAKQDNGPLLKRKSIAKRLKLDKQLSPEKGDVAVTSELNQWIVPEGVSTRATSRGQRDAELNAETGSRDNLCNQPHVSPAVEEDKHPRTRSRTTVTASDAEMLSDLQSSQASPASKKRKTVASDRGDVSVHEDKLRTKTGGQETAISTEVPGGRILRKWKETQIGTRKETQIGSPNSAQRTAIHNDESDQELVATWRSRRRKVQ